MIRIEDLSVSFGDTEAVKHVSLDLADGEILGVVGESGSGKSVTALTLMGLVSDSARITSGRVLFDDVTLREAGKPCDKALYRTYQGAGMSMVFQEPMTSLNPTKRVGGQVEETLRLHTKMTPGERRECVLEAFRSVGLQNAEKVYASYPHQLSGGMRQRVMIAMAVILHPRLIVADEPTTALDVTIQNQIIGLLREINQKQNNAMLFITHDLNLARKLCSRIAVMKDGEVVESGETESIFEHPAEAYTKRLIEAVPSRMKRKGTIASGEGTKDKTPILKVKDLSVFYKDGNNSLFARKKRQCVVAGADFVLYEGESLGLVGESGCGKTSLSRAILGMNREVDGKIIHATKYPQMIFQDPYGSLNPSKTIGWLLMEPLRARAALDPSWSMTRGEMEEAACDMLRKVGMSDKFFHRKPSRCLFPADRDSVSASVRRLSPIRP